MERTVPNATQWFGFPPIIYLKYIDYFLNAPFLDVSVKEKI